MSRPPPLDARKLQAQHNAFLAAKGQLAKQVVSLPAAEALPNKTALFWRKIVAALGQVSTPTISEWVKSAEWSIVQLVGSVEDERRFSLL